MLCPNEHLKTFLPILETMITDECAILKLLKYCNICIEVSPSLYKSPQMKTSFVINLVKKI